MITRPNHCRAIAGAVLTLGLIAQVACTRGGFGSGSTEIPEGPVYPEAIKQSRVLNIQVTRDDTEIAFTNTTAAAIPACRMWVNRWWSRELPGAAVGETVKLDLREFKDPSGDAFRGGGFFATEASDRVVLAQLEISGEIVGLVVIGGE